MQRITLANTQSAGIMRFKTAYSFWALTLIAMILVVPKVVALPEKVHRDVLELRPGGYVYADYPGDFDVLKRFDHDGITVEAWVYFTDQPKDGDYIHGDNLEGQWIIFAKPGSYYVELTGRDLGSVLDKQDPEGMTTLSFAVAKQPTIQGAGGASRGHLISPEEYPLSRWVHIAMQIMAPKREITLSFNFYDSLYSSRGEIRGRPMGRTPAPFVIGGTPIVNFKEGAQWGHQHESMKGYIDEVRVSKGHRYDIEQQEYQIHPPRHFKRDTRTIALWRFEEGPGAPFYRDSSGNDYTLFPGGSLAVDSRRKLATTWGSLKRRVQEAR